MHGYHPADRYSDAIYLSNREPKYPVRCLQDIHANIFDEVFGNDGAHKRPIANEVSA
jgi:hypothetical protein